MRRTIGARPHLPHVRCCQNATQTSHMVVVVVRQNKQVNTPDVRPFQADINATIWRASIDENGCSASTCKQRRALPHVALNHIPVAWYRLLDLDPHDTCRCEKGRDASERKRNSRVLHDEEPAK